MKKECFFTGKMRIVPVLLVLAAMVFPSALFAGGGGSNRSQGGRPQLAAQASGKMNSIKVLQYDMDNQQIDFHNMWWYKELERDTGVRVEWDLVKGANWTTTVNLRFASMELPDLIMTGSVDVEEYGVSQGLLVPLDSYLKDNMPNYYSRLYLNDADKSMYASDGHMYFVGKLIAQNVNHNGNHYINKTWLDRVGMAIPKTVDELTAVLRAFRDQAPNGNPQTVLPMSAGGDGTKAMSSATQGLFTHFAMFGVPLYENNSWGGYAAITSNGRVRFVADYPGFRDAVEWLAMCYSERLLDMESLTQDSNAWGVKMNAGNVGFTTYLRLINTALSADTARNYVSIIPPASRHGVQVPRLLEVATGDSFITIANKYVAQSLQWVDKMLETERMMVAWNGPIRAGGPIPPTMRLLPDGKYDIISVPPNNELYNIVPVYCAPFFAPGSFYSSIYNMPPHRVERYETSRDYAAAGVLEPGSYTILGSLIKPSNQEAIELARLYNEIDKLMQETIADCIRSGVTQAKWDTFTRLLTNVGVPRYIELLQKAYDAYASSL